jgi:hypothetical protein
MRSMMTTMRRMKKVVVTLRVTEMKRDHHAEHDDYYAFL